MSVRCIPDQVIELAGAAERFRSMDCDLGLFVKSAGGGEVGWQPDRLFVAASTFKVAVALDFCIRAARGELDPVHRVTVIPSELTLGSHALGDYIDPVELSLRDLVRVMLAVSDNGATDLVLKRVGIDEINMTLRSLGLRDTVIAADIRTLSDAFAADLGHPTYRDLLDAQTGKLGEEARAISTDRQRILKSSVLEAATTTRTTPRDMVKLLEMAWMDAAGPEPACAMFRHLMSFQRNTRIGSALPAGAHVYSKTGTLFGVAANEVGVIELDGRLYFVAAFTRAAVPYENQARIIPAIGTAVAEAIERLQSPG
jgi:beta-lactamase class A